MHAKNLIRLIRKIEKYHKEVYCGHLTPVEYLYLIDSGIVVDKFRDYDKEWALRDKEFGRCNPRWYYFKLGKFGKTYAKNEGR